MIIGKKEITDAFQKTAAVNMYDAVSKSIKTVQAEAKTRCPVNDGELRGSIYTAIETSSEKIVGICYNSGTYAVKPLLPESVTTEELRKYYIESFRDIPDIVSTREAAELTGATASTVAKWIRTKKLKALSHGPAFIIPKVNLIDFMASDAYLNKRLKSQKFHENIGGFLSWKAGK